jgi:nucleolin
MEDEKTNDVEEVEVGSSAEAETVKPKRKRKRKRKAASTTENAEEVEQDSANANSSSSSAALSSAPSSSSSSSGASAIDYVSATTVYVEGIPYECEESDLRQFFASCGGSVESIRLPRWQDSGRLRGYGHVVFSTTAAASAALLKNRDTLKGRWLQVSKPQLPKAVIAATSAAPEHPPGCKTIHVKGLPYEIDEDAFESAFVPFGRVHGVRLARWNHTNKLKGFGYVEFVKEAGAQTAVNSRTVSVGGRLCIISYETGAPKGSFRLSSGENWTKTQKTSKAPRTGGGGGTGPRL